MEACVDDYLQRNEDDDHLLRRSAAALVAHLPHSVASGAGEQAEWVAPSAQTFCVDTKAAKAGREEVQARASRCSGGMLQRSGVSRSLLYPLCVCQVQNLSNKFANPRLPAACNRRLTHTVLQAVVLVLAVQDVAVQAIHQALIRGAHLENKA